MKKQFIAGTNEPGFMPETDPMVWESLDDARESLIEELQFFADAFESDADLDDAEASVRRLRPGESVIVDGYAYWIA